MTPALSVVVPVRNDSGHLRACLERLHASEYRNYEVIVVDDASTDRTPDVARALGGHVLQLEEHSGPAVARNRGAEMASAPHLFFLDADVCVHPETLARVAAAFGSDSSIDALFGSYDLEPGSPNLLSQYKNLFHHFVHQQAQAEASTFWSGCGAIKRSVFQAVGGFDPSYRRPSIEDIELGARLRRAGHRIVVRKEIQATHLKRWTLWGILKSDVWDRGVPWTELALREGGLPNDLNLKRSQRLAALLVCGLGLLFALGAWQRPALLLAPPLVLTGVLVLDLWSERTRRLPTAALALAELAGLAGTAAIVVAFGWWALLALALSLSVVLINFRFYQFFARERGPLFAVFVLPLHFLYYGYGGLALALGIARHFGRTLFGGADAKPRPGIGPR